MNKNLDLYYWPTPNGWKITILLEELNAPYNIVPVNIGAGDQFKPEFLALSPNNRIPAIMDYNPLDGQEPFTLFESGAIMEYLADKHGKFLPQGRRQKYQSLQWLYWQIGGLGPMAGQAHHFRQYAREKIDYAINRYTNEVHRLYGILDQRLKDCEYLANEYSIADMASWAWVSLYQRQGQDLDEFSELKRWYLDIAARPAVQKGRAIGEQLGKKSSLMSDGAHSVLFNQRARRE